MLVEIVCVLLEFLAEGGIEFVLELLCDIAEVVCKSGGDERHREATFEAVEKYKFRPKDLDG